MTEGMPEEDITIVEDGFPWNDDQKKIIAHKEGPLQIIACAGSGKTLTVSRKVAEMVHNGIDRNSIVAFTFADNAAEELKVRIRKQMEIINSDNPILGKMFIGTIHSFCLEILHEFDPNTLSYNVLDENKLVAFLSEHYFNINLHLMEPRHPSKKFKKIQWFIEDANTLRRENLEASIRRSDNEKTKGFLSAYDVFMKLMEQYHFIDYEGIIYKTVRLLEGNSDILEKVKNKFRYIIVDEYQDVDTAQENLIELLAGERKNLCVVGDDDQSIYKWRGARSESFRTFCERYNSIQIPLAQNFRSTELIVNIANGIISRNRYRVPKSMYSEESADLGDSYLLYLQDQNQEIAFVCDKIQELLGTTFKDKVLLYKDFAILLRRSKDIRYLVIELERRGIPSTTKGDETIFGRPESAFIRLAFAYIAGGMYPNLLIIDVDQTDYPGGPDEIRFLVTEDTLRTAIHESRFLRDKEDQIINGLKVRRKWYSKPTSRRIYPQKEFMKILNLMGITDLKDSGEGFPEQIMYELGRVSTVLKDFETVYELIFPDKINELVEYLDWAYYSAKNAIDDPTLIDAVRIMTIHAAKGTEFPVVFLPALFRYGFNNVPPFPRGFLRPPEHEWIPNACFNYSTYADNEEDYRRLFYVAITRSKKYLFLTGSYSRIGYKKRQNPSIYFQEVSDLNDPNVITESIADPTPREKKRAGSATKDDYVYPTSFTDLRYYQYCPYDYKLRKIYKFAPPIDSAFGYGFAVHDILRELHQEFQDEGCSILPSPGQIRQMISDPDRFYLRYARGKVQKNLRNKAEEILIDYLKKYRSDIALTYKAEEPFEYLIDNPEDGGAALLSGTIDLLQKLDPETRRILEVNVIDFKTGHQPSSDFDPRIRDSKYQVRLYALATKSEFDLNTIEGYIHYLNENNRVPVDLQEAQLKQVEISIRQSVKNIMKRKFFAAPETKKCRKCDFRQICGHSK
jgi:DNA helicase II / ATP-dependent DNA helicase PcrA